MREIPPAYCQNSRRTAGIYRRFFMKSGKIHLSFFSRQNVGRQLGTLYTFTILIPVLFLGIIIYFFSYRQIAENYTHLCELQARQVRSVFTTTVLYVQNIYETIASDDELGRILSQDYETAEELNSTLNSYTGFQEIQENNACLTSLRLYMDDEHLAEDSHEYFLPVTDEIRETDWYTKSASTRSNFWRSEVRTGQRGTSSQELTYYCRIAIPKKSSYALLVMTVSNDYLRTLIDETRYDIYVSVNYDPVFYCSERSYAGNELPVDPMDISTRQQSGTMKIFDEHAIAAVSSFTPPTTSDGIYILVVSKDSLSHIHTLGLVFILVTVFALAFSGLLIFLYTRYFSDRIQTLRLAMFKVAHNDYEIVNSIQGNDELSNTFQDLKSMVSTLKENEAKIYEAQIREQIFYNQQQQMELKLLTSQINPHFLYNTLETIRMKAFSEGNREVANAIKLLGKSMRYVLNNTKSTATTLDKELDYVRTYLAIQKLRFNTKFDYTIRVDKKLDPRSYQILPLLIQPIVENAISHGLADVQSGGHVIIRIYRTPDDELCADIFDNGCGMTEDILAETIRHMDIPQPESDHGVGLYNINNRVHLFYGEKYGLTIKSRPGAGTLVTLVIPLLNLTEEEE